MVLGVASIVGACVCFGACSESNSTSSSVAGVIPPNPGGPSPDGTGSTVLAISALYFGDGGSGSAWKSIGLDIDGKQTTHASTDVCTLAPQSSPYAQVDGDNGIDNSFGENLVPILATFYGGTFSTSANDALRAGDATLLFRLDDLGAKQNYAPLPGLVYRAAPAANLRWDGSDVRNVDTASVSAGDIDHPLLTLNGGYMNARTWVGVPAAGPVLLDLHVAQEGHFPAGIPMTHVRVLMQIDPSNASATHGMISGIVAIADAVAWFKQLADWGSNAFCNPVAVDDVVDSVTQSADIMLDGSNAPGDQCDGISVGIGFDAVAVKLGEPVSVPPPAPPDPCPDGGTRP
jgi:hypothetical protein